LKKVVVSILLLLNLHLYADGKDIIETAGYYYKNGEYYNAITESMRYQHLYPKGGLFSSSMIIMGKSYYRGGRPNWAIEIFGECYDRYSGMPQGEEGLYYSGIVRILSGSYYFGARTLQEYNFVYKGGLFYEDAVFNLCRARALAENYDEALRLVKSYREIFPSGRYLADADSLEAAINHERNRDKKSLLIAGLSSAVIPGSGYFYTGNYRLGAVSMATNGALLFLAYNGYSRGNYFQMIFFSVIEFSFYNYSIVGSVKSAHEYNDGDDFRKEVLTGIKTGF